MISSIHRYTFNYTFCDTSFDTFSYKTLILLEIFRKVLMIVLTMGDLSVTVPPPPNKGHCLYVKGSLKIIPEKS